MASTSEGQIELGVLDGDAPSEGSVTPREKSADEGADPSATTPPVYMPQRGTALSIVYLSVFIDMIGVSIILPVIPFLAIEFKASAFELGLLFSVYAGSQMLANLTTGRLSDRVGRKPVIMVSLAGSALGFMLQGFADSYAFYVAARLVSGLFAGSAPVVQAYIADVTAPVERPRMLGMLGAVIGSSFLFGPGIGAGLAEFTTRTPMFVSAGVAAFGFVIAVFFLREPSKYRAPATPTSSEGDAAAGEATPASASDDLSPTYAAVASEGSAAEEGATPVAPLSADSSSSTAAASTGAASSPPAAPFASIIPLIVLASLLNVGATTAFFTMFGFLADENFGYKSRELGFILSSAAIVFICAQIMLFGKLQRKYGKHTTAIIGALVLAASIVAIPLPDQPGLVFVAIFWHSVGFALTSPAMPSLLSRYAPMGSQGRVLGYGQAADALSRVIMPPVLGALYDSGQELPFMLCSFLAVCSAAVMAAALIKNRRTHGALSDGMKRADQVAARPVAASWDALADLPLPAKPKAESAGQEEDVAAASAATEGQGVGEADAGARAGGEQEAVHVGEGAGEADGKEGEHAASHAASHESHASHIRGADAAIGSFLRHMLRRRGYHSMSGTDPASHRRLRRALEVAFPFIGHGERGRAASRSVSTDGAPGLVLVPELFAENGEEMEQLQLCAVHF